MNSSRIKTVLGPLIGVCVTGFLVWRLATPVRLTLFGAVSVLFLVALFFPKIFAPIDRFVQRLITFLLQVLTYVLLALVFVSIFVPGRLFLLITRKDPLHRKREAARQSYWVPAQSSPGRFERMY